MSASSSREATENWLRPVLVASWVEIAGVLAIFVGPFASRSSWSALHGSSGSYVKFLMSDSHLLANGAVESALLALFLVFLQWRRWIGPDFKIKTDGRSSMQGLLLALLMGLGNSLTVLGALALIYVLQNQYSHFTPFLLANSPHLQHHTVHLSWAVLISAMILNAFFEELICIGYAFNQFAAKLGPLAALILTTLLRMSCHTYQGPIHLLGIGAVFGITGAWYWRTRNLWPLIFSHALIDLLSTGFVKEMFS